MPATAVQQTDTKSFTEDLRKVRGVFSGHKHFLISGALTIGETFGAVGLPSENDAFDALHPACIARGFYPTREPGSHGFWRMKVEYSENDASGFSGPTPEDGLEYSTTLEQSRATETVDTDITGAKKLTNDGAGVPKMVNVLTCVVIQYSAGVPSLTPLLTLSDSPKVNELPIKLKRFMGVAGATLNFEAKQLLYAGFSLGREGGFFFVRHELHARRTWENVRQLVDAEGKPTGTTETTDVYEAANFLGVLGQA